MKFVIGLAVTLTFALVPIPAIADVDVRPDPRGTGIALDALRYKPHSGGAPIRPGNAAPVKTKQDLKFKCFHDGNATDFRCSLRGFDPTKPSPDAQLTQGAILTAIKKIGLPSLTVNIQPGEATLVNFDTIFYAEPQPFRRSVSLLDYNIDVIATPVRYTWHHGDGTSQATNKPGRAYPSKDVTYRYFETAKHLQPRVDVTYAVRYRIDGGAWRTVDQTLQASGPAGDLEVKEATPVLATP